MSLPDVVSREEWLVARRSCWPARRKPRVPATPSTPTGAELPMVLIDKDYVFEGPDGEVGLTDLFEGRRQLVVQHFMFDPSWDEGCPSCTAGVDELSDGLLEHLWARDTTYAAVSRAPLAKLEAYKERKGWTLPWYSSYGSDFNYDFHVSFDADQAPVMYNYRDLDELKATGMGWLAEQPSEQPGDELLPAPTDDARSSTPTPTLRPRQRPLGRCVRRTGSHRARASGGVGGAKGPGRRQRPHRDPELPGVTRQVGAGYSHSMVPGGLLVTSTTTRLTSGTSLVIRVEIRASTS